MQSVVIHTDGASRGNPGDAAIAYVIDIDGQITEFGEKIGTTTNNQAEYRALVAAMERLSSLINHSPVEVSCFADSELMIKQLNGEYRIKDAAIKPHAERILAARDAITLNGGTVEFVAVRRSDNKRADELCNIALDS